VEEDRQAGIGRRAAWSGGAVAAIDLGGTL
jgi:hypothetical protein